MLDLSQYTGLPDIDFSKAMDKTLRSWYCPDCLITWRNIPVQFCYCPVCGSAIEPSPQKDVVIEIGEDTQKAVPTGSGSFIWHAASWPLAAGGKPDLERVIDVIMFQGNKFLVTDKDHIYMYKTGASGEPWELVK